MSFKIRYYQEADLASALSVINAAARADGEPFLLSEADLRTRLGTSHVLPHLDPMQDVLVVQIPGLGVAAYADGVLSGAPGTWEYRAQCFVRPDLRRQGIGSALLERQWARVKEISTLLDEQVTFATRVYDVNHSAQALFEAFSMRPVRRFFEMHRDLDDPISALQVPPGLELLTWAERREDHAVWAAVQEAFADHWRYQPESFDAFERRAATGRHNPAHSYIAWDGDQVAGGVLNQMGPGAITRLGRNQGWIGQLFVRRLDESRWRKRGLGRALMIVSLDRARQMGHRSVGLNVDAENPTGAVRLYESVGFAPAATRVVYHRVYP
jgi:mycothiol synthase